MSGKEIKASSLLVWSYKRGQMVSLLIHVGDRLGLVSGVCVHQVLSTLNLFSLRKNRREGLYYYYYCHRHHDYRIDTYAATHSDCIYIYIDTARFDTVFCNNKVSSQRLQILEGSSPQARLQVPRNCTGDG